MSIFKYILGLLVLHGTAFAQHNMHQYNATQTSSPSQVILDLMHKPMMVQPYADTGNIDIDFLSNMMPHHQGAIDSSKELLKHSSNSTVKNAAKRIIKEQEQEIKAFNALIKILQKENAPNINVNLKKFVKDAKKDMNLMMKNMMGLKLSQNPDKDFLSGMIYHHQGAVAASKQILKYTQDSRIKEIAEHIIKAQEKEIQEFTTLIKTLE
ncbi:Uncharacterized conserved protein, DUF305 family [Brevinema andersonii]|uniref:Uncharacterized conserved protein, DUF305 family n=1 Tax=Brevinema andersonii TaxID=34097 RepID=A0A1I1DZJ5_BREAD|nr:DUF305 domain-containing protein [Brevinema andersonii]SFB80227.1 Uncharacterized conserved protein, DUF305 family [Brevinema andersonii]